MNERQIKYSINRSIRIIFHQIFSIKKIVIMFENPLKYSKKIHSSNLNNKRIIHKTLKNLN
jgi:hypothetical protein